MGQLEKRKSYDSVEEFERDRRRMFEKGGWTVTDERTVAKGKYAWWAGNTDSGFAWVLMLPVMVVGWLIWRKSPEEQIVATYVRED